jgi:signal transduction histidine kinase
MSVADLNRELIDFRAMFEERIRTDPEFDPRGIAGIDSVAIREVHGNSAGEEIFGDTLMFDRVNGEFRTYRTLTYPSVINGDLARITIFKSTLPGDRLVERVTLMVTLMVIVFLGCVFLLNRFVFANLWKDFFEALDRLKEFDTTKEPVVLREQDTEEFNELKKVLERMTRQLSKDYRELKEYTDHTTHELQTPLAVIKSKTELLLQSDRLGPDEMDLIQAINASTNQLARLNSTLALITRIENRQYTVAKEITVSELFGRHIQMLEELIGLRSIGVVKNLNHTEQTLHMDPGLADILAANLVKNAIVHNVEGGKILLEDGAGTFSISNDGPPLEFSEEDLFRRFIRGEKKGNGFGLGLSLVKKICESYQVGIRYAYTGNHHIFTLKF